MVLVLPALMHELMKLLPRYLAVMINVVFQEDGIDLFLGEVLRRLQHLSFGDVSVFVLVERVKS